MKYITLLVGNIGRYMCEPHIFSINYFVWFNKKRLVLKAHIRDKPLYGTLTSGLCWSPWLIPHNVLLNAQNAGSADKRTQPWSNHGVSMVPSPDPICPSELHYTRARIRAGFLRTEIVWHTSQSPHTITRDRIAILIGAWGLAMQRWVWTNEKPYFSFAEVCALLTYWRGKWGNSHANRFLFGKDRDYCPCRKGACHGCVTLKCHPISCLCLELHLVSDGIHMIFFIK